MAQHDEASYSTRFCRLFYLSKANPLQRCHLQMFRPMRSSLLKSTRRSMRNGKIFPLNSPHLIPPSLSPLTHTHRHHLIIFNFNAISSVVPLNTTLYALKASNQSKVPQALPSPSLTLRYQERLVPWHCFPAWLSTFFSRLSMG